MRTKERGVMYGGKKEFNQETEKTSGKAQEKKNYFRA